MGCGYGFRAAEITVNAADSARIAANFERNDSGISTSNSIQPSTHRALGPTAYVSLRCTRSAGDTGRHTARRRGLHTQILHMTRPHPSPEHGTAARTTAWPQAATSAGEAWLESNKEKGYMSAWFALRPASVAARAAWPPRRCSRSPGLHGRSVPQASHKVGYLQTFGGR